MTYTETLEQLKLRIQDEIADYKVDGDYFGMGEWQDILAELNAGRTPLDIKLDMEWNEREGGKYASDEVVTTFVRWASYVR